MASDSNLADLAGSNNSHISECVPLVSVRCDVAQTSSSSSEIEALVKTPQKNRTENVISSTGESTDLGPIDLIHEISPIPKSQKQRTRKRRSQSAAVLTSSPFKKQLMESKTRCRLLCWLVTSLSLWQWHATNGKTLNCRLFHIPFLLH